MLAVINVNQTTKRKYLNARLNSLFSHFEDNKCVNLIYTVNICSFLYIAKEILKS